MQFGAILDRQNFTPTSTFYLVQKVARPADGMFGPSFSRTLPDPKPRCDHCRLNLTSAPHHLAAHSMNSKTWNASGDLQNHAMFHGGGAILVRLF